MTTDAAIAAAKAQGLRVYNLGELAAGGWVANLIDAARESNTGNGRTPAEAIEDCIAAFAVAPVSEREDIFG